MRHGLKDADKKVLLHLKGVGLRTQIEDTYRKMGGHMKVLQR